MIALETVVSDPPIRPQTPEGYRMDRGGGRGDEILLLNGPSLLPGTPCTRFALPAARELWPSMSDTGVKERNYLFKSYTDLRVMNDLMSSLKSKSPLEYPQMHGPSFPLCPVRGTVSQEKK